MANTPIAMNKLRKTLRLYTEGKSKRFIAHYLSISRRIVRKYIERFIRSGLTYEDILQLKDREPYELFQVKVIEELPQRQQDLLNYFPLDNEAGLILMDLIEDRNQRGAMIITIQLPVVNWHQIIAKKTVADAVMDRVVHNAHRLELKGESQRKKKSKITK